MTARPRFMSSMPVGPDRSPCRRFAQHRFEAAGDRLDRRERVVDLVADDADQPLPRLALFVAQRPADVGEHEQLMRTSSLAERRAPHFPAARRAGERDVLDARRLRRRGTRAVRARRRCGRAAARPAAPSSRSPARLTSRSVVRAVEGEDGDVDLDHHRAQQRAGLERAEPLIVQRRGEHVDFEHHRAERIVAAGAARADREVALAQRREQVRQRLQRQHDAVADAERAAGPDADDEDGERPLHLGGVVAGPEQDERDERRREAGGEREQQDALIEAQARVGTARGRIERGESVFRQFRIRNSGIRNSVHEFLIPNSSIPNSTARSAAAADRARCGSGRAPWPPG